MWRFVSFARLTSACHCFRGSSIWPLAARAAGNTKSLPASAARFVANAAQCFKICIACGVNRTVKGWPFFVFGMAHSLAQAILPATASLARCRDAGR